MANGDKKFVVMESDLAVPLGVATLDETGKLTETQRPKYTAKMVGAATPDDVNAVKKLVEDEVRTVTSKGAPTPETVGHLGQHYLDTNAGKEYVCIAADEESGVYTWKVSGGGILPHITVQAPAGSTVTWSLVPPPKITPERVVLSRFMQPIPQRLRTGPSDAVFLLKCLCLKTRRNDYNKLENCARLSGRAARGI